MLAAYVDSKKAFDSGHRETLWDLQCLRGIPARNIGLLTGLYSWTVSAVKCGGGVSSFFPVDVLFGELKCWYVSEGGVIVPLSPPRLIA